MYLWGWRRRRAELADQPHTRHYVVAEAPGGAVGRPADVPADVPDGLPVIGAPAMPILRPRLLTIHAPCQIDEPDDAPLTALGTKPGRSGESAPWSRLQQGEQLGQGPEGLAGEGCYLLFGGRVGDELVQLPLGLSLGENVTPWPPLGYGFPGLDLLGSGVHLTASLGVDDRVAR